MKYPKINTLFKRDKENHIILGDYSQEEFKYLENCKWECTEKIDGTNIRIELTPSEDNKYQIFYKGRTDNAIIPPHLLSKLKEIFDSKLESLSDYFITDKNANSIPPITLFGEGYGVKIQKGGNYISKDTNFILFDIKVSNWWLTRTSCEDIAKLFNIDIVPIIGYMTIPEAVDYVRKGFKSTIAENKNYDAEGLVLKTPNGLLCRNAERIVTKIKSVDFQHLK